MRISALFNQESGLTPRRRGGRPRIAPDKKRRRHITSTYTDTEYSQITGNAADARTSPSVYQRESTLNGVVQAIDSDAGLRLAILRETLTHARHCRATFHKIERRSVTTGHQADFQKHRMQSRQIDELIALLVVALRKEVGLDPG